MTFDVKITRILTPIANTNISDQVLKKPTHFSRLLEAARLFCEEQLFKKEIGTRLKVTGAQAGRLVREALNREIVKITWNPPPLEKLGARLLGRYDVLRDARVISSTDDFVFQRKLLAAAAADYFDKIIQPGMRVAVGGGSTLYDFVAALPEVERNIDIFSTALLARGPAITNADRFVVISQMWAKSGALPGRAHYVTVLPFEKPAKHIPPKTLLRLLKQESDTFRRRPTVKEVFEAMKQVDLAVLSLGPVGSSREYKQRFSSGTSLVEILQNLGVTQQMILNEGVVGEVAYSFFDKDGNVKNDWECFIGLGVDHYKEMVEKDKRVLMIAGSEYKRQALRAALKGRLFNVLITDEMTAEELLSGRN